MTNPNPKNCSKCHKMHRSNFSFLGVTCLVGGMLKIPNVNLKKNRFSNVCIKLKFTSFLFRHKVMESGVG